MAVNIILSAINAILSTVNVYWVETNIYKIDIFRTLLRFVITVYFQFVYM